MEGCLELEAKDIKMKLRFVDKGLANRIEDRIELHQDLVDYPHIMIPILKHELNHTNKVFTIKDLRLDLTPSGVRPWDLFKFMITRPRTWWQLSPLYYSSKKLYYDINLFIIWIIIFIAALFVSRFIVGVL